MKYRIDFIPEAGKDYRKLEGSTKQLVNKKIDRLAENPFLGEKLGNKFNLDLTGFYKLYAAKKKIRIVYRLITPSQIEIVEIWGIGKRDKGEIYRIIGERIRKNSDL